MKLTALRWPTVIKYRVKDNVGSSDAVLRQLLCSELEYDISSVSETTSRAVNDPKVVDVLQCVRTTYVQNMALKAFRDYVDWLYEYIEECLCNCDENVWFDKFIEGHVNNFPDKLPLEFNTENIENIIQQWKDAQATGYQIFAYCCGQLILCPDYISKKSAAKVLDGIGEYFLAIATLKF